MSDLLDEQQSNIQEPIYPGAKLSIFLGQTKFDQVYKEKKGKEEFRQFYANLDAIKYDCEVFKMLTT